MKLAWSELSILLMSRAETLSNVMNGSRENSITNSMDELCANVEEVLDAIREKKWLAYAVSEEFFL
jgi:hypothetical protein